MARLTTLLALAAALLLGALAPAMPSDARLQCFAIEALQAAAASDGQAVVFTGVASVGLALIVFMNDKGEWVAADMDKEGVACLVGQGRLGRTPHGPIFIPLIPEKPA